VDAGGGQDGKIYKPRLAAGGVCLVENLADHARNCNIERDYPIRESFDQCIQPSRQVICPFRATSSAEAADTGRNFCNDNSWHHQSITVEADPLPESIGDMGPPRR
jgi:hypothetical protein